MPATDLLSAAGALALVIGLIVLLRFGTRFLGARHQFDTSASPRLAGQLTLDAKRRLHLVQCGSEQVLVLTGGANDIMLPWPHRPGQS